MFHWWVSVFCINELVSLVID